MFLKKFSGDRYCVFEITLSFLLGSSTTAQQQSKTKLTIDLQQWSITLVIHQDFHWETPLMISLMKFCIPSSLKSVYFSVWISLVLTKTLGCHLSKLSKTEKIRTSWQQSFISVEVHVDCYCTCQKYLL